MGQHEAADLVRRYKKKTGLSQETIAHELSQVLGKTVRQKTVSLHMQGASWTLELPGAYVRALGIPAEEMNAAWGFPESNERPQKEWSIADVVKADPTLSAAAKKHLLGQYDLLQMATQHERAHPVAPPTKKAATPRRKRPAG